MARVVVVLVCSAVLASVAAGSAGTARLTVSPTHGLLDQSVDVRVAGVAPRAAVVLKASTVDRFGNHWSSALKFVADEHGVVDTHGNMKLFWAMRPAKQSLADARLYPTDGPTPVHVAAVVNKRTVAATYTRRIEAADVTATNTTLAKEGFVGTYYASPSGSAKTPAVLEFGGSNGGHAELPGVLLAGDGFPTLSLAYFGEPGLPKTLAKIPLEYFEKALQWLAAQPGVDPQRIVVMAYSRGGEAALQLGVTFPSLVHGVISCEGSYQINDSLGGGVAPAWTYQGKPVPFGPIPVEKINGPVLAFGAADDQLWKSAYFVSRIVDRARAHGRKDIVGRIFENAGHGAGCEPPNVPLPGYLKQGAFTYALGGTIAGNSLAAQTGWPTIRRFISAIHG
jgi:dienelactone hydrolase